ncbi:MAG: Uncharacterised protein [Rhodospirillaceae bacterium]|nr:MAG: Uncharacterised protein [Rhodospirillaceae bacterium]
MPLHGTALRFVPLGQRPGAELLCRAAHDNPVGVGAYHRQAGVERLLQHRDPLSEVGAGFRAGVQDPIRPALRAIDGVLKTEIETVAHVGVLGPGTKVEADRAKVAVEG